MISSHFSILCHASDGEITVYKENRMDAKQVGRLFAAEASRKRRGARGPVERTFSMAGKGQAELAWAIKFGGGTFEKIRDGVDELVTQAKGDTGKLRSLAKFGSVWLDPDLVAVNPLRGGIVMECNSTGTQVTDPEQLKAELEKLGFKEGR